jgi:hypothetical protein
VVSPNTLTDGVTKVPKGCIMGFCHFWHLITLGFSRNTRPHTQHRRDGYGRTSLKKGHPVYKCPEESGHSQPQAKQNRPVQILPSPQAKLLNS